MCIIKKIIGVFGFLSIEHPSDTSYYCDTETLQKFHAQYNYYANVKLLNSDEFMEKKIEKECGMEKVLAFLGDNKLPTIIFWYSLESTLFNYF